MSLVLGHALETSIFDIGASLILLYYYLIPELNWLFKYDGCDSAILSQSWSVLVLTLAPGMCEATLWNNGPK